jgi:hypothetical protein
MTISNREYQEKRDYPRFPIQDGSAVIMTPGDIISYCVLDISASGLAFCYTGEVDNGKVMGEADISFLGENFNSLDIPVQIVYDSLLNSEHPCHPAAPYTANNLHFRRCGVKFSVLSPQQAGVISQIVQVLAREQTVPELYIS